MDPLTDDSGTLLPVTQVDTPQPVNQPQPASPGQYPAPAPDTMAAIAHIESSGNPNARTGSYKGLYQLSDSEFKRYGGQGSIYDPAENARIAGLKLADESGQVAARLGRPLTAAEQYLVHQQGVGGAYEHLMHPNQPAWMSMYNTAEGRQKGPGWAKLAIWGNVPDSMKKQFGSVDNITSGQFTQLWRDRFNRQLGAPNYAAPALPPPKYVGIQPPTVASLPQQVPPTFPQQPQQQQQVPNVAGVGSAASLFAQLQPPPPPQVQPFYAPPPPKIDFTQLAQALQGRGYF